MEKTANNLKRRTRIWILFFMGALAFSGITAMPVQAETHWLSEFMYTYFPDSIVTAWLGTVYHALADMARYPFLQYGYDWLAFAHVMIAVAFIGPLIDPVRNKWVIYFGMIACASIIPLALIAGHFRQIPFWWQVIDSSFGLIGIIPLNIIRRNINQLEVIEDCRRAQLY